MFILFSQALQQQKAAQQQQKAIEQQKVLQQKKAAEQKALDQQKKALEQQKQLQQAIESILVTTATQMTKPTATFAQVQYDCRWIISLLLWKISLASYTDVSSG